jgi:hypothetical protein
MLRRVMKLSTLTPYPLIVFVLIVLALAACGSKQGPAESAPEPTPAAPAPLAKPAAPAADKPEGPLSDKAEDPTFELALVSTGPYAAGKPASFSVSLKPRGDYHVNEDYPFSVTLEGQAMTLPKTELGKADAAEFTENGVRLDVPFTASETGECSVKANVKFAVCTPETCVPDERTLALALTVQ